MLSPIKKSQLVRKKGFRGNRCHLYQGPVSVFAWKLGKSKMEKSRKYLNWICSEYKH